MSRPLPPAESSSQPVIGCSAVRVQLRLVAKGDAELSTSERHHVRGCIECQRYRRELAGSLSALSSLREATPSDAGQTYSAANSSLWPEVERSIGKEMAKPAWTPPSLGQVAAAVASLAACCFIATLAWPTGAGDGPEPVEASLLPYLMSSDPVGSGTGEESGETSAEIDDSPKLRAKDRSRLVRRLAAEDE